MDEDLEASLAGLAGLLTGPRPVRETLVQIAEYAVRAIPGAEGAGLTMLEDDRPQTVVASADFVHAVDDVQYGLGEGPCLLAVEIRSTQRSGSLGGESRWPRFGPRVGRMGVHSMLSLPLLLPDQVVGALNVYAHAKDAFGSEAIRIGELFARPAAVSVRNAHVLAPVAATGRPAESGVGQPVGHRPGARCDHEPYRGDPRGGVRPPKCPRRSPAYQADECVLGRAIVSSCW